MSTMMMERLKLISVAMGSSMFSVLLVMACTAGAGDKDDGGADTQGQTDSEDTSPPMPNPNPSVLDCTQWEVTYWSANNNGASSCTYHLGYTCTMPEGWEPFAVPGGDDNLMLRRCTARSE